MNVEPKRKISLCGDSPAMTNINNSAVEDGRHLVHGERVLISSLDSDKVDTGKTDL